MKYFTFNIIFLLLLTTPQFSQNLEDKNVLVVWGGWDGHTPKKFANIIEDWLKTQNANYQITYHLCISIFHKDIFYNPIDLFHH